MAFQADDLSHLPFRLGLAFGSGLARTPADQELAQQAQVGHCPYMKDTAFLWFDCSAVGPEDSRICLEVLLAGWPDRSVGLVG